MREKRKEGRKEEERKSYICENVRVAKTHPDGHSEYAVLWGKVLFAHFVFVILKTSRNVKLVS